MAMWTWTFGGAMAPATMDVNPATGLPMVGDIGGVDVGGSPYGLDLGSESLTTFETFGGFCDVGSSFEVGFDPGAGLCNDWSDCM